MIDRRQKELPKKFGNSFFRFFAALRMTRRRLRMTAIFRVTRIFKVLWAFRLLERAPI